MKVYCEKNEELMYKVVPASFILDFKSEDIEEELKKFITFFVDCNAKTEPNPEKEEEDMKGSKITIRKKGAGDIIAVIDSPKKNGLKGSKYSPSKPTKFKSEVQVTPEYRRK